MMQELYLFDLKREGLVGGADGSDGHTKATALQSYRSSAYGERDCVHSFTYRVV